MRTDKACAHTRGFIRCGLPIRRVSGLRRSCIAAFLAMPVLCQAGIAWENVWTVRVNGQMLSVEMFTSGLAPDAVMRRLTQHNQVYQRYHVADGRILLSGMASDTHWLAEIHAHPGGAQGYVSALYFPQGTVPAGVDSPAAGIARVFDFGSSARVALAADPTDPVHVTLAEH